MSQTNNTTTQAVPLSVDEIVDTFLNKTYGICDPQEWRTALIEHLSPYLSERLKGKGEESVGGHEKASLLCRLGLARHHGMSTEALAATVIEWMEIEGFRKRPVLDREDKA